jgi:protein SCO1/2
MASCGNGDDGGPAAIVHGPKSPFEGSVMPPGVRAPDFELTDERGKPIKMAEEVERGPVVVTFLYAECVEDCPLMAAQIRGALDDLGHDVPAIAISVKPDTDTPPNARRFNKRMKVEGRLRWALGSRSDMEAVWDGFHIQPQSKEFEHQARILLVDRKGLQRVGYPGGQGTPAQIAHDLRVLEGTQK